MAKNKRTIYLGLDYSQFTGGVTEVNRKMGLLDAEFRLAQQEAKNYGTETDKLGVKQDYLRQKITLQTQKVEAARKAYDTAIQSKKATQKEIDALNKKLIQEQTALEKTTGELKDADKATESLNKNTKSFGDEIRGIASSLGLNVSPAIENLAQKFDVVDKNVGNLVLGLGAVVTGLVKCSVDAAQFADDLLTLSSTTGIATDELQKMQYASDFLDVKVETMTGSMTKMTRTMYSAREGSKEASEAFGKLKLRITESNGQLRDANDVFYEAVDRLGKIKNETERDAIAMQIFGKSAKELNPLIEAGSARLKELGIEAENMGTVIGGESLQKMGQLQDAFDKFGKTSEALKMNLGLVLLPVLTKLFETISSIPAPILTTLVTLATVIATIVMVVKAIKSITDTGKSISTFFKTFSSGASKTTLVIVGIVIALLALAAVIAVIMGKSGELERTFDGIGRTAGQMTGTMEDTQARVYRAQNNASGITSFRGGRTWVGENGPELVTLPRGTSITPESNVKSESNVYYITISAKEVDDFNRVVEMAKQQKVAARRV